MKGLSKSRCEPDPPFVANLRQTQYSLWHLQTRPLVGFGSVAAAMKVFNTSESLQTVFILLKAWMDEEMISFTDYECVGGITWAFISIKIKFLQPNARGWQLL